MGSSLAVLLALGACGERAAESTVGQKVDAAIAKGGEVAREVKQETKEAAAATGAAAREATAEAKTSVMGAAADTRAAAARAGDDIGAKAGDAQITTGVNAGLAADKGLSAVKIDVDTRDGIVTLTGSVPSGTAKTRATDIAKNVKDVKSVNNRLSVKAG